MLVCGVVPLLVRVSRVVGVYVCGCVGLVLGMHSGDLG